MLKSRLRDTRRRWTIFFRWLAFISVIGACSTTSKSPSWLAKLGWTSRSPSSESSPDSSHFFSMPPRRPQPNEGDVIAQHSRYEKDIQSDGSEAVRFWARYHQAKLWSLKDPEKACGYWREISSEPRFPLAPLAQLRSLAVCSGEAPAPASDAYQPWLRETAVRSFLKAAGQARDKTSELRLTLELVPLEPLQSRQVELLERARTLAAGLKDETSMKTALQALERTAPRKIATPTPDQYLVVAGDFRKARDFKQAREYYRKVSEGDGFSDLDRWRALDGLRMTYKLEQNTEAYLQATRDYANFARQKFFTTQPALFFEAKLALARALWTDGQTDEADRLLRQLENEVGRRHPIEESIFVRARIAEEAGQLERAVEILTSANESRLSDRGLRRRLGWHHAWLLRKSGRLIAASERLAQLINDDQDTPAALTRDHFWLGRTLKEAGEVEASKSHFEWLVENDPLGYYGLLAHRELNRRLPTLTGAAAVATHDAPAGSSSLARDELLTYEWLIATDELDLARKFLDHVGKASSSGHQEMTDEQTLDRLERYARAGSYQALFAKLAELPATTRKTIFDKQPELIFPRPWKDLVATAADKYGVRQELIFSIMRQESSFNPTVRSHADALGLMQLIPDVARLEAASADVPYNEAEDLFRPDTNIALGSAHLRRLLKRWDGLFIPAVASYNASERAVQNWLKTRDRRDPLQFIEDIPYEETKGYVKLVMRNFVFYSRLGTGAPSANLNADTSAQSPQSIEFPEWCLNGLQGFKP